MKNTELENKESQERRAYLLGLQLKNSGLEQEIIYARLEKQGISEEIALKVSKAIFEQKKLEIAKENDEFFNIALVRIGIGLGIAILSIILFPGVVVLPIGFILGGIISAYIAKKKD